MFQKTLLAMFFVSVLILPMLVPSVKAATPEEINAAITEGLAWLAGQQNLDGSCGSEVRDTRGSARKRPS